MSDAVDRTLSTRDIEAKGDFQPELSCDEDLPTFWLDICDGIDTTGADYVNLQRNPERYTGYNGSHVWTAIYQENCFQRSGGEEEGLCYEEKVLYRLLSGMHSSITISLCTHWFPPGINGRTEWEPNPNKFIEAFQENPNGPEHLKNLHFAFVVLLRAVHKASPYLYNLPYSSDAEANSKGTQMLMQRLLDSHVLQLCSPVFTAFDESLLFQAEELFHAEPMAPSPQVSLKRHFKAIFHNITEALDCVTCQKCKLHGKMQMLGLGTALKILLSPEELLWSSLSRDEVVALINTLYKFSESIHDAHMLTELYIDQLDEQVRVTEQKAAQAKADAAKSHLQPPPGRLLQLRGNSLHSEWLELPAHGSLAMVDSAVALTAQLAQAGTLSEEQEDALIDAAFAGSPRVLLLARHYANDSSRFARHALRGLEDVAGLDSASFDLIVVGGGLAGFTAALALVDQGYRVVMLEKSVYFGGNSAKASSGINGISEAGDSPDLFYRDVVASGGSENELMEVITRDSQRAVEWIESRAKVKLDQLSQLGGHSQPRTHRSSSGMVGAELMMAVQRRANELASTGRLELLKGCTVDELLLQDGAVVGVRYTDATSGEEQELHARNVLVATGGFGNDHSANSLLVTYRPDIQDMATTNTPATTGDGHKLVLKAGGELVGMEHVQLHPTAFVDPAKPQEKSKTLCAELLRGVGGLLLTPTGKRFADELGTRDYISARMLEVDEKARSEPRFVLLLNKDAAEQADRHVRLYSHKGLLTQLQGIGAVAEWMDVDKATLQQTIAQYEAAAAVGEDEFGKTAFPHSSFHADDDTAEFYAGIVGPAIHYTMGGVGINPSGQVLSKADHAPIPGLWAAGEVTGGIHGKNRLGGMGLLECVVFGLRVSDALGESLQLQPKRPQHAQLASQQDEMAEPAAVVLPEISVAELEAHNEASASFWVALHGLVYDFTEFAPVHPGGAESVLLVAGRDGTEAFDAAHNLGMLEDFSPIGKLAGTAA